jgi:hypothetical protein
MILGQKMREDYNVKKIMMLGLGLMLAGCTTMQKGTSDDLFTDKGLPNERYLVGGGFEIDFDAPCAGTAYLIDVSIGRYMKTEQLDANEPFSFPEYYVDEMMESEGGAGTHDYRLYFISSDNG